MPFDGTSYDDDPILKIIDRVDQLICDEEHWGHRDDQKGTETGRDTVWKNPDVHCPVTALWACGVNDWQDAGFKYFTEAAQALDPDIDPGTDVIPVFNDADERTFPEIKALIRKARELRLADMLVKVTA